MSGLEVQHVTPKYPAYHAIKTLPSMPYCCWYRLGYPDEACKFRFLHLGAAFYPLACSGFLDAKFPAVPILKILWPGWGPSQLPSLTRGSTDLTWGSSLRFASSPCFFLYSISKCIILTLYWKLYFKVLYCFVVLPVGRKVLDQLFCMVYKYSVLFYTAPQWELAFL